MDKLDIISVDFDVTHQLLFIYSALVKFLRKKRICNRAVHQLFLAKKSTYDSLRREVCIIFSLQVVFYET
jgi:hypothetical protein